MLIQFPVGTLGDPMGWFPYAVKFKEQHGCKLTCAMGDKLIPLFRDAYPDITFLTHEEVKPETLLRDLQHRAVLRRQGLRPPALRLPPCRAAPHRRLHPGRRSDRGAAAHRASTTTAGRSPSPTSASPRRARRRASTGTTRRLARDRALPQGGGLPRHLHRPEADPRHRPGVEPHPVRRRGRDRRPAADGAGALAASTAEFFVGLSSGLSWLAWACRHAGGDDRGLHPSDQRVRDALPGDQLPRLQQLLERSCGIASTTRISCGARATRTRRASSNARG